MTLPENQAIASFSALFAFRNIWRLLRSGRSPIALLFSIVKSEEPIFATTRTFTLSIYCESRLLILGVTPSLFQHYPLIRVRHLLLDPSFTYLPYGFDETYQFWLGMSMCYFVPVFHCSSSLGFIYPPIWIDCAIQKQENFVCLFLPVVSGNRVWHYPLAYVPCRASLDGSVDDSFFYPMISFSLILSQSGSVIELLLAVRRFQQL